MSRAGTALILLAALAAADGGTAPDPSRHLAFLSSPEAAEPFVASRYAAAVLEEAGLEPAGPRGGWFEVTGEPRRTVADHGFVLALRRGAEPLGPPSPGEARPAPFSRNGRAEGPVRIAPDGDADLTGAVVLLAPPSLDGEGLPQAIREAAARGAAGVLVAPDPRAVRPDEVVFADGRTEAGFVEDLGEEFLFRPAGDGPVRRLGKAEVSEIRAGSPAGPPGLSPPWPVPAWVAPVPVAVVSGRLADRMAGGSLRAVLDGLAARAGVAVEFDVVLETRQRLRRDVAGRLAGTAPAERPPVRLVARQDHPVAAAVALAVAEALAAGPVPERDVVVVLRSAPGPAGRDDVLVPEDGGAAGDVAGRLFAAVRELAGRPDPRGEAPPTLEGAREARVEGRLAAARAAVDAALADHPGEFRLYLERGRIAAAAGDREGVAADAENLRKLHPESGLRELLLSEDHAAAGEREAARAELDAAASRKLPRALLRRSLAFLREDGPRSLRVLSDLNTLGSLGDGPEVVCGRALLELLRGRLEQAEALATQALLAEPGLAEAFLIRARAAVAGYREPERALADFARAEALGLRDPDLHFDRGLLLLRRGRYTRAVADFETHLALRPDSPAAIYNIACAHSLMGDVEEGFRRLAASLDAGFDDADHARGDPDLENLRKDPRFEPLITSGETE